MRRLPLSLVLVAVASTALAQPRSARPGDPPGDGLRAVESRVADLQRELDRSRDHADRELARAVDSMKTRYDDALAATRWALGLLTLIAAVGSMSWWVSHRDGSRLLEEQIRNLQGIRDVIGKSQAGAADLLPQQLRTMGAVQDVIDFVRESLADQKKGEERLRDAMSIINDLHAHFEHSYRSVKNNILTLKSLSRMDWANLSVFQTVLAATARADFRSIPSSVLDTVRKADPREFAQVCELLGASAFYANDIVHARNLLDLAAKTYEAVHANAPERPEDAGPKVATYYFQALIAKSWADGSETVDMALRSAKGKLHLAEECYQRHHWQKEFLVPVTLAEIESYLDPASTSLDDVVLRLELLGALDGNQKRLLVRALLLQGNIAATRAEAREKYEKARKLDDRNPYPLLSIALTSTDPSEREKGFREGLRALQKTRMLEKHELATRATALSWAVIAARELGDPDEVSFRGDLQGIKAAAGNTGGIVPHFFSPVTKQLCRIDKLQTDVDGHVKGQVPQRPADDAFSEVA